MSATPGSTLANSEQWIADLERQLAEREAELAECKAERDEAQQRETATAEVLEVINSSPGDLTPVFEAIVEKALMLCDANEGVLRTFDGELFHLVSAQGRDTAGIERVRQLGPIRVFRETGPFGRLVRGERVIHVLDVRETEMYRGDNPQAPEMLEVRGIRTRVMVALRREDTLLGVLIIHKNEVRPFTDKQIALLQNFAAQAVIAMENARLITETHEALERQTATAEVLRVISGSPTDLQPTFEAIAARATTLCEAISGGVFRFDGSLIHLVAQYGSTSDELEVIRCAFPIPPSRGSVTARAIITRSIANVPDMLADPEYSYPRASLSRGCARCSLFRCCEREFRYKC